MYKFKELTLVILFVVFAGCNSSDNTPSNSNSVSSSSLVDAEPVVKAAAQIDKLTVDVHKNSYDTTTKLLTDVDRMLHSVVAMDENVTNTMIQSMQLANALAQPVKIAKNYQSLFAVTGSYNSTVPAFQIIGFLTKNYFLLSSETPLFLEKKTVKGYFNNAATLTKAWSNAIDAANKSKNLYLSIVEIDGQNIVHKVSSAFLIKSTDFPL